MRYFTRVKLRTMFYTTPVLVFPSNTVIAQYKTYYEQNGYVTNIFINLSVGHISKKLFIITRLVRRTKKMLEEKLITTVHCTLWAKRRTPCRRGEAVAETATATRAGAIARLPQRRMTQTAVADEAVRRWGMRRDCGVWAGKGCSTGKGC